MYINRTEPREINPTKRIVTRSHPEHASADGAADAVIQEDAVELSAAVKDSTHDEQRGNERKKGNRRGTSPEEDDNAEPKTTIIDVKV